MFRECVEEGCDLCDVFGVEVLENFVEDEGVVRDVVSFRGEIGVC